MPAIKLLGRVGEGLRRWLFPAWPRAGEVAGSGLDRAAVERELVRHAASGVAAGSIVHVILALIFLWGVADRLDEPLYLGWLAAMTVAAGIRAGLCALGVRRMDENLTFAKWALVLPAVLTGAAWGSLAVIGYAGLGGPVDLFIVFVIGGVCLGSLAVSGSYLPAYYAFYLTAFPPLVAVVMTRGSGPESAAMGLMLVVYFLAVLLYARRFSRILVEQIVARMSEEHARRALAETKDMLQAALESRRDGFAVFDEHDRLLFWNRPFARRLEPFFGRLRPGVSFDSLIRASARAQAAGGGADAESWVKARLAYHRKPGPPLEQQVDGRWILVEEYRTPRGHTVLVHTDITELKAREQALRDSEAEKAGILDAALDAVVTVDAHGRILDFNTAAQRLFGWRAEDVVGRSFIRILVPARQRRRFERLVTRFLTHWTGVEPGRRFEAAALTREGEEIPVEVSVAPVRTAGGRLLAGFVRDLRPQKETESALKAARQAAEKALKVRTEFLATMSHEIRTPMTGILGALELLGEMSMEPKARRLLQAALGAGEALRTLLDDLIDVSRIESGRLLLERVPFDLPELLKATVEIFAPQAKAKGLSLKAALDEDLPRMVISDPARLRQVLFNLLSNAVRYTRRGSILLEAARRAGGPGFAVVDFVVRDTGPGIAPEEAPRIFDKFTRGAGVEQTGGGLGLGLAVARALVELMGGAISVRSKPGEGSSFTVRIPFLIPDAEADVPPQLQADTAPPPNLRGTRVLLVDDSATNRMVVAEMLRRAGAEVSEAAGGNEALEQAGRKTDIDVILLDIAMPELDGYATLAALKAQGCSIPVIALTAHAGPEERERILEAGFVAHLAKPLSRTALVKAIAAAVHAPGRGGPESPSHVNESGRKAGHSRMDARPSPSSRVIRRFLEELAQRAKALAKAEASGDREAIALHAHALASAAGFVGEEPLAGAMRRLEASARDNAVDPAALSRMLEQAGRKIAEVRDRLARHQRNSGDAPAF